MQKDDHSAVWSPQNSEDDEANPDDMPQLHRFFTTIFVSRTQHFMNSEIAGLVAAKLDAASTLVRKSFSRGITYFG